MAVYSPKVIATPAGKRHADLYLIERDLLQVFHCCNQLAEEGIDLQGDSRALLDSAIIRYRRCFASGVRGKLIEMIAELTPEEQALHHLVVTLANKHVAHSINDYEHAATTVHIATEHGKVLRSGIGAQMSQVAEFDGRQIADLKGMAIKLLDKARTLKDALARDLTRHVGQLTDDDLLALEDAIGPPSGKGTPSKPRR